MACPRCGSRTQWIQVHDEENPFRFHECPECGWDDYDEKALEAARARNTHEEDDDYEYDEGC